jgi:hypothetical protein
MTSSAVTPEPMPLLVENTAGTVLELMAWRSARCRE